MLTILVITPYFLPGYNGGGPIRSIQGLVQELDKDFLFRIITSDRDLGSLSPYSEIEADRWIETYGAIVRYCSPRRLTVSSMSDAIRGVKHDILYLNSFFSPQFSIAPLLARRLGGIPAAPTILAPRGEFSRGALAIKSLKKRSYIAAGKALRLFDDLHWHASTEYELDDIRSAMKVSTSSISIATNLAPTSGHSASQHISRTQGSPLRVLFLSRISPKKNLDFALNVLAGLEHPINFTIAGPEEDAAYSLHCHNIARGLPKHIIVNWIGSVPPHDVSNVMASNDLFFLPTQGENFCHVVIEALASGTPVLLSDTTPWRKLGELGIGHDLPLNNLEPFRDVLRAAWHRMPVDASKLRERASSYANNFLQREDSAQAFRNMFHRALQKTNVV